jgi:NADPH:quinone reductase-like Zn-dependent oxidoreductase
VTSGQAIERVAGNFTARALSSFTDQKFALYGIKTSNQDLIILGDLVAAGKVQPVIERTSTLSEAPEALRYLGEGHARGKLVVTVP